MRDVAFLLVYLSFIPATFLCSGAAITAIVWMTLIAPNNYLVGVAGQLPTYLALFAPLAVSLCICYKQLRSPFLPVIWIMLLFLVQGAISAASCPPVNSDSSWAQLLLLEKITITMFCIVSIVVDRATIHAVIIAVALGLGFHGIDNGLKYLASGGGHLIVGIPQLGDNNTFGMVMLMVAPIAYYVFGVLQNNIIRFGFLGISALCAVTALGTLSRGALIALVAVDALMVIRSKHKIRNLIISILIGGIGMTFMTDKWAKRMDTIETAGQDSSFMGRVGQWKLSYVIAIDNPMTGVGYSGIAKSPIWESYLPSYHRTFPDDTTKPGNGLVAHSIIFQVLGDLGFPGLAIFGILLLVSFKNLSAIRRASKNNADLFWMRDLANALELSLTAFVVGGLALSAAYYECFYIIIAVIAATRRLAGEGVKVVNRQLVGVECVEGGNNSFQGKRLTATRIGSGTRRSYVT